VLVKGGSEDVEIPIDIDPASPPVVAIAIAMTNGPAWDDHMAAVRARSFQLAIERGHIRR
jgi:hypothetical protein